MNSQPRTENKLLVNPELRAFAPEELAPSEFHVRQTHEPVTSKFVRNVERVGIIHPPIARREEEGVRILDGVRRVRAAARAGFEETHVLMNPMTDAEALELSISLNLDIWWKPVTDTDEERALHELHSGTRRMMQTLEDSESVFEARRNLGLVDDADQMLRVVGSIDGVGEATSSELAEMFDSPNSVSDASVGELCSVPGIGRITANKIYEYFDNIRIQ